MDGGRFDPTLSAGRVVEPRRMGVSSFHKNIRRQTILERGWGFPSYSVGQTKRPPMWQISKVPVSAFPLSYHSGLSMRSPFDAAGAMLN